MTYYLLGKHQADLSAEKCSADEFDSYDLSYVKKKKFTTDGQQQKT